MMGVVNMGGTGSGMPKAALLKLDGTQIDHNGKISKSTFFDFLNIPLGEYADLEKAMTPEAALKFRNHVVRMNIGTSAAIPMLCPGPEKCNIGLRCPFTVIKKYPVTEPCPLEIDLVQTRTRSYIEELSIDPESMTQMILINRLVELDLLDYRANIGLSGGRDEEAPSLLKTTITETDQSTTESVDIHPLLNAKSKFHSERLKTLEALVATRRERYKKAQAIGISESTDAAKHMSELSELVKAMKKKAKGHSLEAINNDAKKLQEENEKRDIIETDWELKD